MMTTTTTMAMMITTKNILTILTGIDSNYEMHKIVTVRDYWYDHSRPTAFICSRYCYSLPWLGLWGVLNNAGVISAYGPPDWFSVDDYRKACEVNLWGLIDLTLTFLPLVKRARGRIVNTSSIGGRVCFHRSVPYCISKFGVEAFTDGIRFDSDTIEISKMVI